MYRHLHPLHTVALQL